MRHPAHFGTPATTSRIHAIPMSCPARIDSVPSQMSAGDDAPTPRPYRCSRKSPTVRNWWRRRLAPDPRPDPEGEQQRADAGRPVPPPGAQAVAGSRGRSRRPSSRRRCWRRAPWRRAGRDRVGAAPRRSRRRCRRAGRSRDRRPPGAPSRRAAASGGGSWRRPDGRPAHGQG